MKIYKKPVILIDTGLAEGVYAASGAGSEVGYTDLTVIADWGNNSGQASFTLDLSKVNNHSQLTVMVSFNHNVTNGWGGEASANVSGNNLRLYWYKAPMQAEITVQADAIKQLQITGCVVSNS